MQLAGRCGNTHTLRDAKLTKRIRTIELDTYIRYVRAWDRTSCNPNRGVVGELSVQGPHQGRPSCSTAVIPCRFVAFATYVASTGNMASSTPRADKYVFGSQNYWFCSQTWFCADAEFAREALDRLRRERHAKQLEQYARARYMCTY